MALGLTVLSIIAASFALGVNFAEIRAELSLRRAARARDRNVAYSHTGEIRIAQPANTNLPGYRPAA
jgi:hypothetical protein